MMMMMMIGAVQSPDDCLINVIDIRGGIRRM